MITKSELIDLYVAQKKTDAEIAKLLGYANKTAISYFRKKWGIAAIQPHERKTCNLNNKQLQVILGGILGDSTISFGDGWNSHIDFAHGEQQKNYLFWKYHALQELCISEPKKLTNGNWRFRTFSHPVFTSFRQMCYKERKIVTRETLDKLDNMGLAVWYMDDGSNNGYTVKISTCCFDEKEHNLMIDWLYQKFGVKSKISNTDELRLHIDKNDRHRFLEIVEPHVLSCMFYKLKYRRTYVCSS